MSWQWQNEHLWQSCSEASHAAANALRTEEIASTFKQLVRTQPLVAIAEDAIALQQVMQHAAALRQVSERLVVVGTGGASLGGATLCALSADPSRVRFLENCDPITLAAFLRLERETTSWCIISKSGETAETLATALALIDYYRGQEKQLAKRVRVITASLEASLATLARHQGWQVLEHPSQLGGRFSAFSIVGLFPAAYAGMEIAAIATAAQDTFTQLTHPSEETLWQHAQWFAANANEKPIQLMMGYADRLRAATQWYKQLWAESLGKSGKGPTPVTAIGAIDQHSQLQLYLDGPRDKLVTLVLPDMRALGKPLPEAHVPGLKYLSGRRMGEVMHATAEATVATLAKAGVPMRVARGELTPISLAQLMARQMLETLLVAAMMQVNPFDQPAVEAGKKLAREALARGGVTA